MSPEQQFPRLWWCTKIMGRRHKLGGILADNQNYVKGITAHWRVLRLKSTELQQRRWQQNSIFLTWRPCFRKNSQTRTWKSNTHGRCAIVKHVINENNAKRRKKWRDDHKTCTVDDRKYIIWSEESPVTLFPTSGRVCVWRTPKEAYNPECLVPTAKHWGGSVMICAAISWYFAGSIMALHGRDTACDNVGIASNHVHPVVQMFRNNGAIFHDDNSPTHTARSVQSWSEER